MGDYDVLIVGAGHAGAQAAISLRQSGFEGSIGLMGEEAYPPYERPPLSKEYFAGDKSFERILIRPEAFWSERQISLLLGQRALSVDPTGKCVETAAGAYRYQTLIWATGGTPRKLSCAGADATNIHAVRNRADVDAIMAAMKDVSHVTIVGGGYIGLEAAAVLSKFGKSILLLEALDRVLARVAGKELSQFYEAEHRAHGVDLRTGAMVDNLIVREGVARQVVLTTGEQIATDMIIVGIGIEPETGALKEAGAAGDNGVDVNEFCQTSLPDIYAIGDCAAHRNGYAGGRIRLESVQNANDQAKVAAAHIVGKPAAYDAVPWFWSNQYDLRLQTVGISTGSDQRIVRGDPAARSFSVIYLKEGRIVAADAVNAVKDYVQVKAHIVSGQKVDAEKVQDSSIALKEIGTVI